MAESKVKLLEKARLARDSAKADFRSALERMEAARAIYDRLTIKYCEALDAVGVCPHCRREHDGD